MGRKISLLNPKKRKAKLHRSTFLVKRKCALSRHLNCHFLPHTLKSSLYFHLWIKTTTVYYHFQVSSNAIIGTLAPLKFCKSKLVGQVSLSIRFKIRELYFNISAYSFKIHTVLACTDLKAYQTVEELDVGCKFLPVLKVQRGAND